jgi:hypothetical protein
VSLLGLIVFPYQVLAERKVLPNDRIDELYRDGWPAFQQLRGDKIETLDDLVSHLRNAISHYQVHFDPPNERTLETIEITFGRLQGTRKNDRVTKISGAALQEFVERFSLRIEDLVS